MEKDNRNSSEDILTRLSLLTDDVNVNSIKGWPYINLGEFFQKDYPEMFSALKLGINIKKCNISIQNVESYCFYDDEGNIDNIDEDAPELLVGWGVWKVRSFYLSKKDLVALSKFMIKYYEIFIEEYKEVERQLNQ